MQEPSSRVGGHDTRTWPRLRDTRRRVHLQRTRDPVAAEELEESFFERRVSLSKGPFGRKGECGEMRERPGGSWQASGQEKRGNMEKDKGRRLATGGPVESWQSRLLVVLDRERENRARERQAVGVMASGPGLDGI